MNKKKHIEYIEWMKLINSEFRQLKLTVEIALKINEIEESSNHFQKHGLMFLAWQNSNFECRLIVQLARIIEFSKDKDNISFYNLLKSLKENNYITYNNYQKNSVCPNCR